jgi:hypothetical protein
MTKREFLQELVGIFLRDFAADDGDLRGAYRARRPRGVQAHRPTSCAEAAPPSGRGA